MSLNPIDGVRSKHAPALVGRDHGRLSVAEAPRWRLTGALLDAWAYPNSARFLRFLTHEFVSACGRVGNRPWEDVLGFGSERAYFDAYPTSTPISVDDVPTERYSLSQR